MSSGFTPGTGGPPPPIEEEEEEQPAPSFDDVVAQAVTDIGFVEGTTPAAPPPPPAPPPMPPVELQTVQPLPPPAPAPPPGLPGFTEFGPGEALPPEPEPIDLLQQILMQEQNTQLPGPLVETTYTDFMDHEFGTDLIAEIEAEEQSLTNASAALESSLDPEMLLTIQPPDLDLYYQNTGITPTGPLAGLNTDIAAKNAELTRLESESNALASELLAQDTESFSTQAQIDAYNAKLDEYWAISDRYSATAGEINGLYDEYARHSEILMTQREDALTELFGDDGLPTAAAPLIGQGLTEAGPGEQLPPPRATGGLMGRLENYDALLNAPMPGEGLLDPSLTVQGTPRLDHEIVEQIHQGLLAPTSLAEAKGGIAYRLTQAGEEANRKEREERRRLLAERERQMAQRQILQQGFSSQQYEEMRDDPGFQEFLSQLTSIPAPPGLAEELGITQIAARESPYEGMGFDPIPEQATLRDMLLDQPGALDTLKEFGIETVQSINDTPVLGEAFRALSVPGEVGARGAYSAGRDIVDVFVKGIGTHQYGALQPLAPPVPGVPIERAGFNPPTTARGRFYQPPADVGSIKQSQEYYKSYDDLPWYVTLTGEMVVDPLNLIAPLAAFKAFKGARLASQIERTTTFTGVLDDAFKAGTTLDTAYVRAVQDLSSRPLTKIDTLKLNTSQARFSKVAKDVGVRGSEADIFGTRVTARLSSTPSSQWTDVLNQEVGRMADRTGRQITDNAASKLNKALKDQDAFGKLNRDEFWNALDGQFPRVMTDTPQWRQARNQVLPDPNNVWSAESLEQIPLDKLVSVGYGPDAALTSRWQGLIDFFGNSRELPSSNTHLYVTQGARGPDAPSEAMLEVLRSTARRKGQTLADEPATISDYWESFYKITRNKRQTPMPGGMSVDQVVNHPDYLKLRTVPNETLGGLPADIRVTNHNLSVLTEQSIMRAELPMGGVRNQFDRLAAPQTADLPYAPFSNARANHLINTAPASASQRRQLQKLAESRGKSISTDVLNNLTWTDAQQQIRGLKGKKPKSLGAIAQLYSGDAFEAVGRLGREELAKREFRAGLADLLTPSGEGRYVWTAGVQRPTGVTANGWLRLSENEVINLFRNAPARITKGLPTFGPRVDEIGATAALAAKHTENIGAQAHIIADAREGIDALIDEAVEIAGLAESKVFMDWIMEAYDGSSLARPGRARKPQQILKSDAPEVVKLNQAASELNVRLAERAAVEDQLTRLRAATDLATYTKNKTSRRIDWDDLAAMDPGRRSAAIREHFRNATTLTRTGFEEILREARFLPGGTKIDINKAVSAYQDLKTQLRRLDGEIADISEVADDLARQNNLQGLPDLSNFSNGPGIQAFAADLLSKMDPANIDPKFDPSDILRNYKPENATVHPRSNGARALWRGDSTVEVAYSASINGNRPAWHYTSPVMEAPVVNGNRVIASRTAWDLSGEAQQRISNAFNAHTALPKNTKTPGQIAGSLTPANLSATDEASQALIIIGTPLKDAAGQAGVSIEEMRRLRTGVIKELEGPGVTRQRLDRDAKGLRQAADLASDALTSEGRRTGMDLGNVEIRGGLVRVPSSLNEAVLRWVREQQKLRITPQPARATVAAAKWTGRQLAEAFDFIELNLRSNSDIADQWARVEGIDSARWVRPQHQRPLVSTFDPFTRALVGVDWVRHGSAFDQSMRVFYEDDEVWGKMAKRLTGTGQAELTKMSKSVKIGDMGSMVGARVRGQIFENARLEGANLSQVYDNILDEMDEIVTGTPRSQMLYGAMFDNSDEMRLWLDWSRAKHPRGGTNWDQVKANWGDITPHMSLSRMPSAVFNTIFRSDSLLARAGERLGDTAAGRAAKQTNLARGNRQPVSKDIQKMDDFVHGRLDLKDLNEIEKAEAELWQELLLPKWDSEIRPAFFDATNQRWRRNVHIEDLDKTLFPDEALDPFDAARFEDNLGTKMTEIEMARLGYNPHDLPLAMRVTHFIKRTLGIFWLNAAPRYLVNNVFGNYMSLLLAELRSDFAGGARMPERIRRALDNKSSSVNRHRMLNEAFSRTEFTKQGLGAGFVSKEGGPSRLDRMGKTRGGKAVGGYLSKMRNVNDFFELHARSNIWSRELDGHYTAAWGKALDDMPMVSPIIKDQLRGEIELADIARISRDLTPRERNAIFRAHHDSLTRAELHAYHNTRRVMRDYLMRTRFDNALDQVFPYHFWSTKNLMFVTGTVLDRPATVIQAGRVYDEWSEQWDGMPDSFKFKLHAFDVPEQVPGIGGSEIWLRPNNMTNPAFFFLASTATDMKETWDRYEDTTLGERFQRTMSGGLKTAFEEAGYRPGPQYDAIATAGYRADKLLPKDARDEWRSFFEDYGFPAIRPGGYRQEVIPLGGIEQALPFYAADQIGEADVVMAAQAHLNGIVHGTPWTRGDLNMMGIELTNMAIDGALGPVTVNDDGTMNMSREATEAWQEVQALIVAGDVDGLLAHPLGSQVLERRGGDEARRAGINYGTGLSISEYDEEWRRSYKAQETYTALKLHDDQIPLVAGDAEKISPFNQRIVDAAAKRDNLVVRGDYSPESVAEAAEFYDAELKKIYAEADKAGVTVPQLKEMGPDAANTWAFGDWNPATEQYEGAHAPWLPLFWHANDSPEQFEQYLSDDREFQQRIARGEAIGQSIKESSLRRGKTAPYFNDIDSIQSGLMTRLAELERKDYLSEAAKDRLADELIENSKALTSNVYAQAEKAGVQLKGSGTLPYNTSAWYELIDPGDGQPRNRLEQAAADGDARAILSKYGIKATGSLPVPVPIDQMISLVQKEDAIQAHTEWVMNQVVEALDLHRFVPGTNEPNPKFMNEGYFDEALYQRELKKILPEAVATYDAMVADMRSGPPGQELEVYARGISPDEFRKYVEGEVLPRENAWNLRVSAAKDEYFAADFEEQGAIKAKYDRELGPDWLGVPSKYKADHGEVTTILSNFYNGLIGDERDVFEREYGEFMVDAGEVRVFDPDKLDADKAGEIARKYDIAIPTDQQEYEMSAGREAVADFFFQQLSKKQKDEFLETYGTDDYPGFVVSRTGFNEETGESYTFTSIDVEALAPDQVAEIRKRFGIELEPYPTPERLPDENETYIKPDNPKFTKVLEDAAFNNETESWKDMVQSGEAFLEDPEDRANWQSFYTFIANNGDLYDAAQAMRAAGEWSWKELLENTEPRQSDAGEGMTIREFAEVYTEMIEEFDMGRLWDARSEFFTSEEGQSVFARDPEFFERYISSFNSGGGGGGGGGDSDGGSGSGGGSGGGSRSSGYRSSGGYRSYGGGGSSRGSSRPRGPSISSYSGEVADIFRLDTGMVQGTAPDAQARFEVATQIGELLQARLEPLLAVPGGEMWAELLGRIWRLWAKQVLGDDPTLELWQQLLLRLGGEAGIPVSDALAEQPEMAPSEDVPINGSIVEEAPEEVTA